MSYTLNTLLLELTLPLLCSSNLFDFFFLVIDLSFFFQKRSPNKTEPIHFTSTERTKENILKFLIENASSSVASQVEKIIQEQQKQLKEEL